jgi:hypothetical protein
MHNSEAENINKMRCLNYENFTMETYSTIIEIEFQILKLILSFLTS